MTNKFFFFLFEVKKNNAKIIQKTINDPKKV